MKKLLSLIMLFSILLSLWPVTLSSAKELPSSSEIETDVWLMMTCEGGTASIQNLSPFAGTETVTMLLDGEIVGSYDLALQADQTIEESVIWTDLGVSLPLAEAHTIVIETNDDQASASAGPCVEPPEPAPSIDIEKLVSVDDQATWEDADSPPGPEVMAGSDVYFKFLVTNIGDVALTGITLNDSLFDAEIAAQCLVPPELAADETFECLIGPFEAVEGQHMNVGVATGVYEGTSHSDTDLANYYGLADPGYVFEQYVNGQKADTVDDAVQVYAGDDLVYTYEIVNTGNVPIKWTDLGSDFGSLNQSCGLPRTIAVDKSASCEILSIAADFPGGNEHLATASVKGLDDQTDPAWHITPAQPDYILTKYVNDQDANTVDKAAEVNVGDELVFRYEILNTGNVPLEWLGLADDVLGNLDEFCYFPTLIGVGESAYCEVTDIAGVFPDGKKNIGKAFVNGPLNPSSQPREVDSSDDYTSSKLDNIASNLDLLPKRTDPAWYKTPWMDLGCTYCQGYWRDNPDIWPLDELDLGGRTYTKNQLLALLDTPTTGDASLSLAHQLIGAKLNIANGADDTDVAQIIVYADQGMVTYDDGDGLPYGIDASSTVGQQAMALASVLEAYNMGIIGPGHCDDGGPSGPVSPGPGGPGLHEIPLYTRDYMGAGLVSVWNSRDKLRIRIKSSEGWRIKKVQVYVGADPVPTGEMGVPDPALFPYETKYTNPVAEHILVLDLKDDLGFSWGQPYGEPRIQDVAVHAKLILFDATTGKAIAESSVWAFGEEFPIPQAPEPWPTVDPVLLPEELVKAAAAMGLTLETTADITPEIMEQAINNQPKGLALLPLEVWQALAPEVLAIVPDSALEYVPSDIADEVGALVAAAREYIMLVEASDAWGWWFTYELAHPGRGHFIDSPVQGLSYHGPTQLGKTDVSGGFDYFPGERIDLTVGSVYLGSPLAAHKVSPLDIFEESDTDDPRVINMARFLQSMDADAEPKGGINITPDVEVCLDQSMLDLGLTSLDFANDAQVEDVIQGTIEACDGVEGVTLAAVSAEEAKANLDKALDSNMFRKNVSKTPDLTSTKSKLNVMRAWFPALRANNDPAYYVISTTTGITATGIPYYDEDGELIRVAEEAKPIVVVYTDGVEETGYEDVFAAISRDDGNTWKRKNLSRAADRSSFVLANGEDYYGQTKKPVFQLNGNNILVSWGSKFCRGGKPAYSISLEDDYLFDDPYWQDDIWGVGGPQRSRDYTEGKGPIDDYPEVGEIPYSCVWVARGTIVTQGMINSGVDGDWWAQYDVGEIVWFKPERLTSGRRDAIQVFMGVGDGAGFGVTWQEDPDGLRPGKMCGPGFGWSGATVNHKTDVWYSYMTQADFRRVDTNFVAGGDPEHDDEDFVGRPKALVPMALPVRISDNDTVNTDNLMVELDEDGYPVEDEFGNWIPITGTTGSNAPEQGSPIPLVVLDAANDEYLGGFTDADCTSCHYDNIVPRDRVVAINDQATCESLDVDVHGDVHGVWKLDLEAYYPYEGYPFVIDGDGNVLQGSIEALAYDDADLVQCVKFEGGKTIVLRDSTDLADYYALPVMPDSHHESMNCTNCHLPHGTSEDAVADSTDATADANGSGDGSGSDSGNGSDGGSGTHRYGYEVPGLCVDFYEFTNQQGELKRVCTTEDGRLLDGNTGASRPNLFLKPFTRSDGSKSAWAIMAYEETKGVGAGPPDHEDSGEPPEDGTGDGNDQYFPDVGKNVIYHSFEYTNPPLVSAGDIVNLPERDEDNNLIYLHPVMTDTVTGEPLQDEEGNWMLSEDYILDWQGNPQLAYENARRPRFIIQGKSAIGDSRTVMVTLYKEGPEGAGRQSDIMMRRIVVPGEQTGNPYRFSNIVCDEWATTLYSQTVCVDGVQNMSSVSPTITWINPDREPDAKGDGTKVVEWVQLEENLDDRSFTNPYDDSRAHRGAIRGDFILMGYSYTPNWASSRNAHDKYDFYIRRSFDGGQTWTTDPLGAGVWHTDTFKIYTDGETEDEGEDNKRERYDIVVFYGPGEYEPALNLSQLPNNKESVIEPRIVGTPSTIKDPATGLWNGIPEDKQNTNVFYVSYGTATNVPKGHGNTDEEEEAETEALHAVPLDLYYSFTQDQGETFVEVTWEVKGDPTNPDISTGDERIGWDWLAKGDPEQGEAQLRMTPDGSRFYATWIQDGEEGSDIWFRRIMPPEFPCNTLPE